MLKHELKTFMQTSSIQGLKRIVDSPRVFDSIAWAAITLFFLSASVFYIRGGWLDYQSEKTETVIDNVAYPLRSIPFPTITICSYNMVYKPAIQKFVNEFVKHGIHPMVAQQFFYHNNMLVNWGHNFDTKNLSNKYIAIYNVLNDMGYDTAELLLEVMMPCDKLLLSCRLGNVIPDCRKYFQVIRTETLYCCAFNRRALKDRYHIKNHGFLVNDSLLISKAGVAHGLKLTVDIGSEHYVSPLTDNFQAVVVNIGHSHDIVSNEQSYVYLQAGETRFLVLQPVLFESDANVRSLTETDRKCRFDDESDLKLATNYSFRNCMLECQIKTALKLCGCVPFYHRFYETDRTCTILDTPCLRSTLYTSTKNVITDLTLMGKRERQILADEKLKNDICVCLPKCTYVTYGGYNDMFGVPANKFNKTDLANVVVYFESSICTKYRTRITMSWDTLLAALGGLFGLCMGGSLISVIELALFVFKIIVKAFNGINIFNGNFKTNPQFTN